jgi:hypothetical protein
MAITTGEPARYESLLAVERPLGVEFSDSLAAGSGTVYHVDLPAGTESVTATLDAEPTAALFGLPLRTSRTRIAYIPATATTVGLDRAFFGRGPDPRDDELVRTIDVTGYDRLIAVVVASSDAASFDLNVALGAEPAGVSIVRPSATVPAKLLEGTIHSIAVAVSPTLGGAFAPGIASGEFRVEIDGIEGRIGTIEERDDEYILPVWPGEPLAGGDHDISVKFRGAEDTEIDAIHVATGPEPGPPPEPVSTGSLGVLAQGESASVDTTLAPGAAAGTFTINWEGSVGRPGGV